MLKARFIVSFTIALFAASVWLAMAAEDSQSPAKKPAVQELEPAGDKAGIEKVDPYAVPDSSPKVLVGLITNWVSGPPPRDEETKKKIRVAILTAAEKILADTPNKEEFEFAVRAKMNMLETLDQLADFAAELKKGGHDQATRLVRGFMLQVELDNLTGGEKKDVKKPIEAAVKYLEEAPPRISDQSLAYIAGTLAEMKGDRELAVATYDKLLKIFKSSNDPRLADFTNVLEGVVRRLNLVGRPMKLEGKFLDGQPLDWPKYAGKVVLVVFWATEYPPCLREVPVWKTLYERYQDKGFEIVGISLDRDNNELENYVKLQSIPWPNVTSDGKPDPNMIYYGVTNLPTTMLVGKDGKVLALDLRGEQLRKELEKLLGPAESKKE